MTKPNQTLEEKFYAISNELFDAAHEIYYYRDTKDFHDDGLAEAQETIENIAKRFSRNYGDFPRLFQEYAQSMVVEELEKTIEGVDPSARELTQNIADRIAAIKSQGSKEDGNG